MISGKYNKDLMMRYNKLKHNQELKYVLYFIFEGNEPIYVGVSKNFDNRVSSHYYNAKNTMYKHSANIYRYMQKDIGNDFDNYEILIYKESDSIMEISELEEYYIYTLKKMGYNIKNSTYATPYSETVSYNEECANILKSELSNTFNEISVYINNNDFESAFDALEEHDFNYLYLILNIDSKTYSEAQWRTSRKKIDTNDKHYGEYQYKERYSDLGPNNSRAPKRLYGNKISIFWQWLNAFREGSSILTSDRNTYVEDITNIIDQINSICTNGYKKFLILYYTENVEDSFVLNKLADYKGVDYLDIIMDIENELDMTNYYTDRCHDAYSFYEDSLVNENNGDSTLWYQDEEFGYDAYF